MSKVIFGLIMSVDGFINDADGSASRLYASYGKMENLRETEDMQQAINDTGAVVMGRHSYAMSDDYTGYEFQVPLFVVTHEAPKKVAKGENDKLSFTFVTDGLESAIQKAKAAAGDKDVTVVGGANIAQQLLKAKLVDELHIDVAPILLTGGLRLFDHLGTEPIELELFSASGANGIGHLKYRVVK